jgi:Ankyrin repeat
MQLEAEDAKGRTPLHVACGAATSEVVGELARLGADVNHADAARRTPLHVVVCREHSGARAPDLGCLACSQRDDAVAELMHSRRRAGRGGGGGGWFMIAWDTVSLAGVGHRCGGREREAERHAGGTDCRQPPLRPRLAAVVPRPRAARRGAAYARRADADAADARVRARPRPRRALPLGARRRPRALLRPPHPALRPGPQGA